MTQLQAEIRNARLIWSSIRDRVLTIGLILIALLIAFALLDALQTIHLRG